ncbi:MAG: HD domain-containing phosphohydrolase [Pseudomonadota bacterium]
MTFHDIYPLRILGVDDDQLILDLYRKILSTVPKGNRTSPEAAGSGTDTDLSSESFDIILCKQGDDAVETVRASIDKNRPFAIAFIDMLMSPGPDGLWTAENIRKVDPHIQIVLVTGYSDIDLIELSRRVPPLDKLLYLQKPFQFQEIWQFASSLGAKWQVERQFRKIQIGLETMVEKRTSSLLEANVKLEEEITSRIQTENSLRESEEKYRSLFEDSRDAIYISDSKGKLLDVNQFTLEIFDYTREEMSQMDIHDIYVNPEDRLNLVREIDKKGSVKDYEVKLRNKNGKVMDCLVTSSVWRTKNGKVLGYQGIIRDISEQKRSREELDRTLDNLQTVMKGTIQAMAYTVETRDPYTAGHQQRVADLSRAIANEMGLPENQIEGVFMAGVIHDLGKISVPAEILSKPGRIPELEFSLIKIHPQSGYDILKGIEFPWPIAQIVLQHHERMDGSGYPRGLSGEDILIEARILAVADVVEAMASHRPYRPALGIDAALEEISANKNAHFDQDVVDACLKLFDTKDLKSSGKLYNGYAILDSASY